MREIFWLLILAICIDLSWTTDDADSGQCPTNCTCFTKTTDCSNLQLTSIPESIQENMEKLDLSKNQLKIKSIPGNLKYLKEINLSKNAITQITFTDLPELLVIDVSINPLKIITINGLKKLSKLNLSYSSNLQLHEPGHSTVISETLENLDLRYCNVSSIKFLKHLPNLQTLQLRENMIVDISAAESVSLTNLDISRGKLKMVNLKSLKGLPNLINLDISGNREVDLNLSNEQGMDSTILIENINASEISLSEIKIDALPNLENADFSINGLINIKDHTFSKNNALNYLNLSRNEIKKIEDNAFLENTKLLKLDVSRNELTSCAWAKYTIDLLELYLSQNSVTDIQLLKLEKLKLLDASDNEINLIPPNFSNGLPNLEYLDFSHNQMEHIPQLKMKNLKTLLMHHCQINWIDYNAFRNMNKLRHLDLQGNKLTTISVAQLQMARGLQYVLIDHNVWHCNCSDKNFKELYKYLQTVNTSQLKCEAVNSSWYDVCGATWSAHPYQMVSIKTFLIILAILALIVFSVSMIIYANHRYKARQVSTDDVSSNETPRNTLFSDTTDGARLRSQSENLLPRNGRSYDDLPPPYDEAIRMGRPYYVNRITRSVDDISPNGMHQTVEERTNSVPLENCTLLSESSDYRQLPTTEL